LISLKGADVEQRLVQAISDDLVSGIEYSMTSYVEDDDEAPPELVAASQGTQTVKQELVTATKDVPKVPISIVTGTCELCC